MAHAIIRDGAPVELHPGKPFADSAGVQHPAGALRLWSAAELAAIGVYPIVETPVPAGHRATASALHRDAQTGAVTRVYETEPVHPTPAEVDAERERRTDAGFAFNGVRYQSRAADRENIAGAATAALAAVTAGAQPGDLRWHGGETDFVWIAEDNGTVTMDAQTVLAFGLAAMAHKSALIFAARALKNRDPIPADYADDGYWPAA